MPKGTISQFEEKTGHGLIEQEDGSVVRFHRSALVTPSSRPRVGDHVTYDIGRDGNGPVAANITVQSLGGRQGAGREGQRGPAARNIKVV